MTSKSGAKKTFDIVVLCPNISQFGCENRSRK